MPQIVHVIKPTGGRFEMTFNTTTPDAKILESLDAVKATFGYNKSIKKIDPDAPVTAIAEFEDKSSGYAYDHPDCIVAVLKTDESGNVVMEDEVPVIARRLKG